MKQKVLALKSSLSALVLVFVLLGGLSIPGAAPDGPEAPTPFPIEGEEPDWGDCDDGIQPLSDLDGPVRQSED